MTAKTNGLGSVGFSPAGKMTIRKPRAAVRQETTPPHGRKFVSVRYKQLACKTSYLWPPLINKNPYNLSCLFGKFWDISQVNYMVDGTKTSLVTEADASKYILRSCYGMQNVLVRRPPPACFGSNRKVTHVLWDTIFFGSCFLM